MDKRRKKNMNHFNKVVEWFKESELGKYVGVQTVCPEYNFCTINTPTLTLGFCNKHNRDSENCSYVYINGLITFDQIFDKWRNCYPPSFHLPQTKEQFDELLKFILFVSSKEYLNLTETLDVYEDEFYDELEKHIPESILNLINEEF